jgi:metal-dependent hydrolase (beta-lactamase superfamily II)
MLRSTAVISLLFLISWSSAFAAGQQVFSIKVFTSPDDQFWTNSVIIEGEHEVMLVDAQLTKTSAEKVLQEINATKKPLSIIYITYEHADHFIGLEVFKEGSEDYREFCGNGPNQQGLSRENRQMEKDLGHRCNLSRCCYRKIRRRLY